MICITKKENEKLPICGKFIYNAGFISLDRSDAHQAVKTIKKAADFIANDWGKDVYKRQACTTTSSFNFYKTCCF